MDLPIKFKLKNCALFIFLDIIIYINWTLTKMYSIDVYFPLLDKIILKF